MTAQTLGESISLTPLWSTPAGRTPSEGPFGPECNATEAAQGMLPDYMNASHFEVIIFHCPPRVPIHPGTLMVIVIAFL